MDNAITASVKEKISLEFKHLPSFAGYLLHHELENFVKEILRHYDSIDIPILRFFKSMSGDQVTALATGSTREMLTLMASNNTRQYIEQTIRSWINNQLPVITREQINSHDITLVNHVKGRVFRLFIPRYTEDTVLQKNLIEELERFTVILNTDLFSAFIELQNQEISKINEALIKRERQLLEAQEIGQV